MPNMSRKQLFKLCVGLVALPLAGCAQSRRGDGYVQQTFFNFDTMCVLGGAMGQEVLDEAQRLCSTFEQLFSRTIDTSDVARINVAAGAPVEVDPRTVELVQRALLYCKESGGLFDITVGAVSELWDFTKGIVPSDEAIRDALPHVGWQGVEVQGNTIRLADPLARIDLGGIAKGYITDKIMELFVSHGVTNAFVNLGGNVKVLGHSSKGAPWSVGVRDPWDESGTNVVAKISTTNGSLVTSGLYERSFELEGKRYWHILDPRTGYPVQTDVVSASVFSVASIDGDGYTKPLFMMSHDEALAYVQKHEGLQALLVVSGGTKLTTSDAEFQLLT